jgi:nitrile hydratase subunit alpha
MSAQPSPSKLASSEAQAAALRAVLEQKGILPQGYVEKWEQTFDQWGPENGARMVARAWKDPQFLKLMLTDTTQACREMGFGGPEGGFVVALENTPTLQNVIVCSLCSCTAWPVLGLPPEWYKSFEYRSRVVREARQVLREMGTALPPEVEIKVYDTTAETRYMVLPVQPKGTEDWTEAELASIVTKNCLIGVARPDPSKRKTSKEQ